MRSVSERKDHRPWHIILRDYHMREGSRVGVTLPKLKFLEKDSEKKESERAA